MAHSSVVVPLSFGVTDAVALGYDPYDNNFHVLYLCKIHDLGYNKINIILSCDQSICI